MARLLHRVEYDTAAQEAVAELHRLCVREGIFYDYLSDFITETCVHKERVRSLLTGVLADI